MDPQDEALRRELDRRTRDWDVKLRQMRSELDRKDSMIRQERERADMASYIQRRRAEERDEIAPELMSFITGSTPEEVEASITRAKAKTASILEGIQQAQAAPAPASFPVPQPQAQPQQAPTLEQLQAVEPGSPEHLALRRAYGMDRSRGRGIFG